MGNRLPAIHASSWKRSWEVRQADPGTSQLEAGMHRRHPDVHGRI
jgi:hypothetical protein